MFVFKNIKRHLTGREKIITLSALIITLLFGGVLSFDFASAMTYQDEVNVQFTFEPSLSISLSSPNLIISNLVPGNYSNSNTITVDVTTNNIAGYTLTAKVGGTGQTAANNSLVNTISNTAFTSLGDSDNIILPNFSDNKWGFSTAASITDATTFSGLLYNEDKVINATTNYDGTAATGYTGTNSTKFTIGAKASADQAAGDYTNVITFTAVTNAVSRIYMQNITLEELAALMPNVGDSEILYDNRDEKPYVITHFPYDKFWMTQNLDHDIDVSFNYNSSNTNIPDTWTPLRSTYATGTSTWCVGGIWNSQEGYCELNYTPESYDPGNLYWNGVVSDGIDWGDYYASCDHSTSTVVCDETLNPIATYTTVSGTPLPQYHIGNFYNWNAAVAMNDSTTPAAPSYLDIATQSICPAGWGLPDPFASSASFEGLWNYYGFSSSSIIYEAITLWGSPLYTNASGSWMGGVLGDVGATGSFWMPFFSSNSPSGSNSALFSTAGYVDPDYFAENQRGIGYSVRCVFIHHVLS